MTGGTAVRVLGDGTIYFGAIATAVMAIVGAIYAVHRANVTLIQSQVNRPLEKMNRDLNDRMNGIASSLNGRLDERIDGRVAKQVGPVAEQVQHIDAELARHLPGYRQSR